MMVDGMGTIEVAQLGQQMAGTRPGRRAVGLRVKPSPSLRYNPGPGAKPGVHRSGERWGRSGMITPNDVKHADAKKLTVPEMAGLETYNSARD